MAPMISPVGAWLRLDGPGTADPKRKGVACTYSLINTIPTSFVDFKQTPADDV